MDYKKRFGLKEAPFRLSPDPGFFFPSQTHREALETLVYAIRSGEGFIQITGQPGTGKSVTLRKILKDLGESVVVGLILHSNIRAEELLHVLMQDLNVDLTGIANLSRETLMPLFRDFLLEQARLDKQVVIIVDEAQNLPDNTLEELRMLSNLETEKEKLLQIILVGQVELEDKISATRLAQLSQRITLRYRLSPLNLQETTAYIFHRLEVASKNPEELQVSFRPKVIKAIHKQTRGIPRLINIVCERSLMAAFVDGHAVISMSHLDKALVSIRGEKTDTGQAMGLRLLTWGLLVLFICVLALWGYVRVFPGAPAVDQALTRFISKIYQPSKKISPPVVKSSPVVEREVPRKTAPPSKTDPAQAKPAPETIAENTQKTDEPAGKPQQIDPAQWVVMPQDSGRAGVIFIKERRLTILEKKGGTLVETRTIPVEWHYPQGVYMAGVKQQGTGFIFHPEISNLADIRLDSPEFWKVVKQNGVSCILPLIVLNDLQSSTSPPTAGPGTIMPTLENWITDWQAMDLDRTMAHNANAISIYSPGKDQPLVFSNARLRTIKADIFNSSGFIKVGVSSPVCLINPLDTSEGFAVFHQVYKSQAYEDAGIKVLYFKRLFLSSGASAWKITGKLWIKDSRFEPEP